MQELDLMPGNEHIKDNNLNTLASDDLRFPVDVFPSPFYEFITECSNALNFPIDYTGTAVLLAVATIVGKSAKLKVKEGWLEFPAFFAAIIGSPGANKSHPLDKAFEPLINIDRLINEKNKAENIEYEQYLALSKKDKKGIPPVEKPKVVKSILHNFTPEILHQRLVDNTRGCAVVSEELATFFENMNNYSKGDQISTYLSFWSNKGTSIDRVSMPVPLFLLDPFLNVMGSLQPRVLTKLFPPGKSDNGFLQRFLFAFPDNADKKPINDNEIGDDVINNYGQWIEDYLQSNPIEFDLETEKQRPKIYYWSNEAKAFFYMWQASNTVAVNENAETLKGEIINKYDIHFIRLSLIFQLMDNYRTNEISIKAVERAAKLCSYFLNCAMKVVNILEDDSPVNHLPKNKKDLFNRLPAKFTTAEANAIGATLGFDIKFIQRFMNDEKLFLRASHGNYTKKAK
ncbi:Protein of unknown function [Mucilaginibacter mallensis]|uniref:DUF3987 domain-containing protein n=1 Tax=Mucilaginibacter mallensis TaxID=652787 RepID=A0A1H1VDP1_MUCMA|nr:DUF3987 domain-containing protein [Mucilaginibacter mallensis]SDS82319.1 Protein of unknown function [Mucilaginibacter mallensis]